MHCFVANAAKKIKIFLFYCKATSEAANSSQEEMMSQRFFLVPSVRFGLGFVVFSTLWKQHGNLLLNGEFQMPFQSLHGVFSRPAQGMGVTLGSLSLR